MYGISTYCLHLFLSIFVQFEYANLEHFLLLNMFHSPTQSTLSNVTVLISVTMIALVKI